MNHFFAVDGTARAALLSIFDTLQRTPGWQRARGSCFCMAGFLALVFESMGAKAQVHACYAVASEGEDRYALGFRGMTVADNQVDGHVVCVVNDRYIVDFGTTNVRRYFLPTFPVAVAAPAGGPGLFPAGVGLGNGRTIVWHADPDNAPAQAAMSRHWDISRLLFEQYRQAGSHNRIQRRAARHQRQRA